MTNSEVRTAHIIIIKTAMIGKTINIVARTKSRIPHQVDVKNPIAFSLNFVF
jgi:hypothetical protein